MTGYLEDRDNLAWDISYALGREKILSRRGKALTDDERRTIAGHIADYLKLANWQIRRGAPSGDFSHLAGNTGDKAD